MPRAIVIGATSGIGRALALLLGEQGYTVGITGRRVDRLDALQALLPRPAYAQPMDVAGHHTALRAMADLITTMGGVDLVVVNAGTGHVNPDLDWEKERETIAVNVAGFAAIAGAAYRHFVAVGGGHLVGISSIAAHRGSRTAPAYNASKAFLSNYLEGLRGHARHAGLPIAVTDIKPGFVDTAMAKSPHRFWVASPEEAARQIHAAIRRRARHAYVTRRWAIVGWAMRAMPGWIWEKL